jgi:hypothetical protein
MTSASDGACPAAIESICLFNTFGRLKEGIITLCTQDDKVSIRTAQTQLPSNSREPATIQMLPSQTGIVEFYSQLLNNLWFMSCIQCRRGRRQSMLYTSIRPDSLVKDKCRLDEGDHDDHGEDQTSCDHTHVNRIDTVTGLVGETNEWI